METLRLCLWSGPRNVSTGLMYSFARRSDTEVVDEPLYAHYLRVSGADHPGRDEVLDAQDQDGARVVQEIVLGPCDRPVRFMKHMAHHLIDLDRGFLRETCNVLLLRDPREMLPSLVQQIPQPALQDTSLGLQHELFEELRAAGREPPVVDSRELLLAPEGVLRILCQRIGLQFEKAMLEWPEGGRAEDGVWAPHWYHNLHRSRGFQPYSPKTAPFPTRLEGLLEECRPHYEALYEHAIRAEQGAR